jgi:hypothetical protein
MLSESFNFSLFSILQEIESIQYNKKDFEGLPFDFHGGFVGYLGYVDFHDFHHMLDIELFSCLQL